jgi:hypothetical protein
MIPENIHESDEESIFIKLLIIISLYFLCSSKYSTGRKIAKEKERERVGEFHDKCGGHNELKTLGVGKVNLGEILAKRRSVFLIVSFVRSFVTGQKAGSRVKI